MKNNLNKILLISLDTFRIDNIHGNDVYENSLGKVINYSVLDTIAENGVFFNNCISAAPYTATSHAAFFTGLWPKNNGVYDHFNSKLKAKSIFGYAKEKGYTTFFKSDFPLILGKYLNFISDVDHYFIEDTELFFDKFKKSEKALGFIHFGNAHIPYGFQSLKQSGKNYENKVIELENYYSIKYKQEEFTDVAIETFREKEDLELLYRYKNIVTHLIKKKDYQSVMKLYSDGINYFFQNKLDNFLLRIKKYADENNCLVIIFADHGENWSSLSYGHFNSVEDECLRIPLIFYGNDLPAKKITDRIRSIDLLPTLNDMIFNLPLSLDGESLCSYFGEEKSIVNREAFSGIWVNEMSDIKYNQETIIKHGYLDITHSRPLKYGACLYSEDIKTSCLYKENSSDGFFNDTNFVKSIRYSENNSKYENINLEKNKLEHVMNKIEELNIHESSIESIISDEIKKYHRLLGYGI